jgi:thioredoxin reductase
VLVCDDGNPRNAAARAVHGFLTRDGVRPGALLRRARQEVVTYGVEVLDDRVASARRLAAKRDSRPATFELAAEGGRVFRSRKLLLATGVVDVLPEVDGLRTFYGKGVHHCPYCDGWEHRGGRLVAFGEGEAAAGLALTLRTWSDRVTACTHGQTLSTKDTEHLTKNGIAVRTERVARLGGAGSLRQVVFEAGPPLRCDAHFVSADKVQRSELARSLGVEQNDESEAETGPRQGSGRRGLFLAGDADGDVQFVAVAVAEGATAAVAINRELQDEDRGEA